MNKRDKFLMEQSIIILCLTVIFTVIVFFLKNYYFSVSPDYIEENYIEPTRTQEATIGLKQEVKEVSNYDNIEKETLSGSEISEIIYDHYHSASPFVFEYIPEGFEGTAQKFSSTFGLFLQSSLFKNMIYDLNIVLHKQLYDVRGKMKNRSVHLHGYTHKDHEEYLSVGIHELAHFIDIYFLEKKVISDVSDKFYEISWESTKTLLPGKTQADFVSGYAMTNKYEDFAESFTYFILHNDDFVKKARESEYLQLKYDYFDTIIFKGNFKKTDFSLGNEVLPYYRDITKIDIDIEKLLQYFENGI